MIGLHSIPKEVLPQLLFWVGDEYRCSVCHRYSVYDHWDCGRRVFNTFQVVYCECARCYGRPVYHYFPNVTGDANICRACTDHSCPTIGSHNVNREG